MRRFLTLVFMLCLAIPAGISISGCTRNPAGNYCNGLGYGLKNTDVASITLQPKTTGISLAFGQTRQISRPPRLPARRRPPVTQPVHLRHHQQSAARHLPYRQHVRRHLEPQLRRRHSRLHHSATLPIHFPSTSGLPYGTCIHFSIGRLGDLESGRSVCPRPGEFQSCALVGPQQCLSQRSRPRSMLKPASLEWSAV